MRAGFVTGGGYYVGGGHLGRAAVCRWTGGRSIVGTLRASASAGGRSPGSAAGTGDLKTEKVVFSKLQPDEFRHPLDTQATRTMSRIFGFDILIRSLITPAVEQVLFLDNISTGVLVGQNQLPKLHNALLEACSVLNIKQIPELYVRQNPVPNAYTLAMQGKKPFIVLHTSLIELLSEQELQAVIAHELGHLKCEHGVWLTMANLLVLFSSAIFGNNAGFLVDSMRAQLMRWLRSAELSCDRAALLVAQDPKVVISVMMKLAGGSTKLSGDLNVEEYMKQAQAYENATKSRFGSALRRNQIDYLTHPLPILRVTEIEKWASSGQYRNLVRRAKVVVE